MDEQLDEQLKERLTNLDPELVLHVLKACKALSRGLSVEQTADCYGYPEQFVKIVSAADAESEPTEAVLAREFVAKHRDVITAEADRLDFGPLARQCHRDACVDGYTIAQHRSYGSVYSMEFALGYAEGYTCSLLTIVAELHAESPDREFSRASYELLQEATVWTEKHGETWKSEYEQQREKQ